MKKIIIGTRGSDLALWQAKHAQHLLYQYRIESELKIIQTSGDKNQAWQTSFDTLEGKNFFTKELEEALLNNEIDIAIHSLKDVEYIPDENSVHIQKPLILAGFSSRHHPHDLLILHKDAVDTNAVLSIKKYAKIGTASARRYTQLKTLREDLEILPLRGNVPTRIQKLKNRQYDGIILARAGIERLNIPLDEFFVNPLPLYYFVPAAGQGIITFQIRQTDTELFNIIQKISDPVSEECAKIERHLLKYIGSGCSKPTGILCEKQNNVFHLYISFNTHKEETAIVSTHQHLSPELLVEKARQNIQHIKQYIHQPIDKKIFISRSLDTTSYLKKLCQRLHWLLCDKALIQTKPLTIRQVPHTDWIFFNSKNAIKYLFESAYKDILQNKKLACIHQSTAKYLEKYGFTATFTGTGNNIEQIAEDFLKQGNPQSVLFPCSTISLKRIGKIIERQTKVYYLPVYETIETPVSFNESFDVLIFTSPSNVRSFLKQNIIPPHSRLIALGKSTQSELLKHQIPADHIFLPLTFDEWAIAGTLISIL